MVQHRRIVTFTTDFGDHFALAQMKASVLMVNSHAKVVTISNQIKPFSILEGSFVLSRTHNLFPKGTIHVGVVDPGVGTKREGVVIQTTDYIFIGPNNGLFYESFKNDVVKAYKINEDLVNPKHSNTFHGRDIFARLAGILTLDEDLDGYAVEMEKEDLVNMEFQADQVLHIDHYGNIKVNRNVDGLEIGDKLQLNIHGQKLVIPFFKTFGDIEKGEYLAYKGSHNIMEIAKNLGSANQYLKLQVGDILEIEKLS